MTGLAVAVLLIVALLAVLYLAHWRQLDGERRAGLHDGACKVCGHLPHHDDCPVRGRS